MKLSSIQIKNYKALRDINFPLSNFVCLTGENNAGKSSVLQAVSLFLSPAKLDSHHFFDPSKEITISIVFSDIDESDLTRLDEEPRERIRELIKDGKLELTRRFQFEGETELGYYTLLPKEKNSSACQKQMPRMFQNHLLW
jgi:predicted ATP-dependent endonuclease of OLD family